MVALTAVLYSVMAVKLPASLEQGECTVVVMFAPLLGVLRARGFDARLKDCRSRGGVIDARERDGVWLGLS